MKELEELAGLEELEDHEWLERIEKVKRIKRVEKKKSLQEIINLGGGKITVRAYDPSQKKHLPTMLNYEEFLDYLVSENSFCFHGSIEEKRKVWVYVNNLPFKYEC
ncbi:MAG: hypothetical protein ABH824_05235 [Nanoarchaeota archaeon]|nr:hypothetical protein [Nanoarchaeota archaeon]MBU1632812.1 hypothetical protein [Nanoarchaeota archaeon]MBU1876495.1 hypothetical protein [Nanoarchaeota archaeon]